MRKAPEELVRAARGRRLAEVLGGLDVVICCGSGGVGKTTVSAALAAAIRSARSGSRRTTAPPSPAAPRFLDGKKLKQP